MSKRSEEIRQQANEGLATLSDTNINLTDIRFLLAQSDLKDKALREIADHPHSTEPLLSGRRTASIDYLMGVQDGHRCAASIARAALAEEES